MQTHLRYWLIPAAIVLAGLIFAGTATAATFTMTPRGCISDLGDPAGCGAATQGLAGAGSVAISPDGRSVYVASPIDNAVVRFDRDTATGALTPQGCFSDPITGPPICGATANGLDQPRDIVVSADGESVYVAADQDASILHFDRDTATGALTPQACIARFAGAGCAATALGLNGAHGVAISADGKSVYVAGPLDDAIVRFDRNTTTGALTAQGCIGDATTALCGSTQQGLNGARGVAISAGGGSLYVVSQNDHAIVRFDRSTTTGALTPQGCISDVVAGPPICGGTAQGLDNLLGVTVSPDDRSVYVTSREDDALVRFDRDLKAGALTPQGCIADAGDEAGCGVTQQGLLSASSVVVSPDGESVYAAAGSLDNALTRFDRDASTGAVTPVGCIADSPVLGCATTTQGLGGAQGIAISDDGNSVYVVGGQDSAIVRFDRRAPLPMLPPGSEFTIGRLTGRSLFILLPGPGFVEIRDAASSQARRAAKPKRLLKPTSKNADAAGELAVKLKLTKAAKRKLKQKGKLRVRASVTFTPTGGSAKTEIAKLKVKK